MIKPIDNIIKSVNAGFNLYLIIFLSLLAGVGFILGSFSLALWFIENTGEIPKTLILIFKGFDFMMWIGVFFVAFKSYLWALKKYILPFAEEQGIKRKEKKALWMEEQHQVLAEKIAKEIKKTNRRGKK